MEGETFENSKYIHAQVTGLIVTNSIAPD